MQSPTPTTSFTFGLTNLEARTQRVGLRILNFDDDDLLSDNFEMEFDDDIKAILDEGIIGVVLMLLIEFGEVFEMNTRKKTILMHS